MATAAALIDRWGGKGAGLAASEPEGGTFLSDDGLPGITIGTVATLGRPRPALSKGPTAELASPSSIHCLTKLG